MAIGVRDITNLEELLEVQDDDKIIIIQNGEAKLVSKANAKFGGGTVTVFYSETISSTSASVRLVDINRNPISAQAAYDAVMSGSVYIIVDDSEGLTKAVAPILYGLKKSNGEIVTVAFMADLGNKKIQLYAGANPGGHN